MQLTGFANGQPCPLAGHYVVSYDPTAVVSALAYEGGLVTTEDVAEARRFPTAADAWACWKAESGYSYPQNAPLTAFTVTIQPARA